MFIKNFESVPNRYEVGKRLGEYIQKNYNIPPMSINSINGDYVFSDTPELKKVVSELPYFVRVFYK